MSYVHPASTCRTSRSKKLDRKGRSAVDQLAIPSMILRSMAWMHEPAGPCVRGRSRSCGTGSGRAEAALHASISRFPALISARFTPISLLQFPVSWARIGDDDPVSPDHRRSRGDHARHEPSARGRPFSSAGAAAFVSCRFLTSCSGTGRRES
jgi:hypothetical protein